MHYQSRAVQFQADNMSPSRQADHDTPVNHDLSYYCENCASYHASHFRSCFERRGNRFDGAANMLDEESTETYEDLFRESVGWHPVLVALIRSIIPW